MRRQQSCNLIIVGDFNLPSIEWNDGQGTVLPNPTYGNNLNEALLIL